MKKIIELKNITKSFDGEQPVLKNINLDIYDISHPSGSLRLRQNYAPPAHRRL